MKVLESFSLNGMVALVTGAGDPAGYGVQCASALHEAGATVFIASRNQAKLAVFAAQYPGMKYLPLDLEAEGSVRAIVPAIVKESGRLDILVNNAVARTALAGWDVPMEVFDRSLRANASALFVLTRLAAEQMIRQGDGGSIINIGSYMGVLGLNPSNYIGTGMQTDGPEWPSPIYHYEKGGMLNFTRWAASVLGRHNIRVNCVSLIGLDPGNRQATRFTRQHAANTLLGRCCGTEDLKGGIVYLASQASAFVTGTQLTIDGGYSAI